MNSKYYITSHIELYVNAEELHFLANAATEFMQNHEKAGINSELSLVTNHLQELSMRAMEVKTIGKRGRERGPSGQGRPQSVITKSNEPK